MRNTFIMISNFYGEPVRINVDHISYYLKEGDVTLIKLNTDHTIYTQLPVEELDQILMELYFMVKK